MAPSMHTGFTPARVNGKCVQVSIFANPDETLYYFSEHKGHQGIAGTPVERYLQDAIDNEPELTWHKQMKDLFSEVIHEAKQTRDFSPERILQIKNKYDMKVSIFSKEWLPIRKIICYSFLILRLNTPITEQREGFARIFFLLHKKYSPIYNSRQETRP